MILFHIHDAQLVISNRRAIKKWIQGIIESHDKRTGDINIIFCRSDYLLELNKKYLEHDYYTDVITFPYSEERRYRRYFHRCRYSSLQRRDFPTIFRE